jgi:quinolinate synthase
MTQPPPASDSPSIDPALDLFDEIDRLRKERNAIILAHYYQESEIQDLADFVGDSLELARKAVDTKADVIAFAGVHFMAETARILNPDKKVVVPDLDAGCSLADGCPAPVFEQFLRRHPGAFVVSYINCSAAVKALSDVICTSSSAEKILSRIPADRTIVFGPDRNLGAWLSSRLGRPMILWPGSCIVHETFSERKLLALIEAHPEAEVLAHPECEPALLRHANFVGSTSVLLRRVHTSPALEFIVATEPGILHQMSKSAPDKKLFAAPPEGNCSCNECPHMRRNTLEKLFLCLRDLRPEIELPPDIAEKARIPIERMLEWSA